jgi:hypothetical protein
MIREVPRLVPFIPDEKEDIEIVESQMLRSGVSFQDAAQPALSTALRGVPNKMRQDDCGEQGISFVDLAARPQFVRNFVWDTSNSVGQILYSARVPWDLLAGVNITPFKAFMYFQGDVEITVQMQSQPFQQGKLICYFVPLAEPAEVASFIATSLTSQTVGISIQLPAGEPRDVTIRVPFVHFLKRLSFTRSTTQTLGTFVVSVFNTLNVGESTQNYCNMSVFVKFPRADFQVLDPQLGLDPDDEKVESQGGVLGKVRNVTRALDKGVDFAQSVSGAVEGFALDAPSIAVDPIPIVRRGFPVLAAVEKVEFSEFLGERPSEQRLAVGPEFGLGVDEQMLTALRKRLSFSQTFRWTFEDAPNALLLEGIITPCPGVLLASAAFQPTLMEYACLPFSYWRGSLKFLIEFVGTSFHSGRLAFITRLGKQPGGAVSLVDSMSQYASILDMTGSNPTFELEIPWRSDREMCSIPHSRLSGLNFFDIATGVWQLVVLNQLQYNEAVAPYVDVNVYLSVGDDFITDFAGNGLSNNLQFENSYV